MTTFIKYSGTVIKILKKIPGIKFILIPISWTLMPIYKLFCQIPAVKVMNVSSEIEKLEQQKKFNEARILRHSWLKKPKFSQSEELWCSEGKDLLFNKKEYSNALETYEKAIKLNPSYDPIEMYYGASAAAIHTGDNKKAEKYYSIFIDWWNKFSNDPELKKFIFYTYSDNKKWLENNIKLKISEKS